MCSFPRSYQLTSHGIALGLALAVASPVIAQDTTRTIVAGIGAQLRPSYPGADRVTVSPYPLFSIRRPGEPLPVDAPDESTGVRLLRFGDGFSIGPVINFQTKRDESDVGAPVGNVGFTVEPGLFVQSYIAQVVRLRVEARHGIGGHNAFVGDVMADYVLHAPDDRYVATIGPRLRLGEAKYDRRYFGVTPERSILTGLPAYRPGGGVYAVGAAAGLLYKLTQRWGAYGYVGYDRLTGNGADSPIVRRYGSRNQFSVGLAGTYSFDFKR